MINGEINQILYCLPPGQQIYVPDFIKNDKQIIFHSGLPDFDSLISGKGILIVLDDLMNDITSDVMELFTRGSHHKLISCMLLIQNIFYGNNKFFRTISLNVQIFIVMKNPRDKKQISILASQLCPDNINFVKEAFLDATKNPFSYMLFDLSQKCDDRLRLRTNIFPEDEPCNIIYVPTVKK